MADNGSYYYMFVYAMTLYRGDGIKMNRILSEYYFSKITNNCILFKYKKAIFINIFILLTIYFDKESYKFVKTIFRILLLVFFMVHIKNNSIK